MSRFYSVVRQVQTGLAWLLTLRRMALRREVLMKELLEPTAKGLGTFPAGFAGNGWSTSPRDNGQAGEAFDYVSKLANYEHPVLSSGKADAVYPAGWGVHLLPVTRMGERDGVPTTWDEKVDGTRFAERFDGFTSGWKW
jgi:hypothetical protein